MPRDILRTEQPTHCSCQEYHLRRWGGGGRAVAIDNGATRKKVEAVARFTKEPR